MPLHYICSLSTQYNNNFVVVSKRFHQLQSAARLAAAHAATAGKATQKENIYIAEYYQSCCCDFLLSFCRLSMVPCSCSTFGNTFIHRRTQTHTHTHPPTPPPSSSSSSHYHLFLSCQTTIVSYMAIEAMASVRQTERTKKKRRTTKAVSQIYLTFCSRISSFSY